MVSILLQCHLALLEINTISDLQQLELDGPTISNLLRVVDPFLLVDHILWRRDIRAAQGKLNITNDIWFYSCHFTDGGMMPGVLQTEVMLQTIVACLCHDYSTTAKHCLINKSSVNFFEKIQGAGLISVNAQIGHETKGLIVATATLQFRGKKTAIGSFRFILPSKFKPADD